MQNIIAAYEIPQSGVNPEQVLALCQPHMDSLCKDAPKQGWMEYTFHWLLAQYFPENYTVEQFDGAQQAVEYFTEVLNEILKREAKELPFDPCRDFALLKKEEEMYCSILPEYRRFLECFDQKRVYTFMRIARVCTPYETLGHIAGVHHVSMFMARQLAKKRVPVDLGLMSGAALMHDIGKYGCRPKEGRRVPYLHYYYTFQYCKNNHLETIGDIASNHSVWDLELENLSTESLLLIYADFRVKSVYDKEKKEQIRFWSLDDAYEVILSKLDNVDEVKKKRYARVYAKLKDFENYMISLGCAVDLVSESKEARPQKYASLMKEEEIIERFKTLAIRSNLAIMSTTLREEQFISFLENIRSERDWRHVRAYLTAIEEYSAYLPQNQKKVILEFLFDMMSHKDGDIRRQAAEIAGILIAGYEIQFAKEIPDGYQAPKAGESLEMVFQSFLERMLHPHVHAAERERRYAGFAMKRVLHTLLEHLEEKKKNSILKIYIDCCQKKHDSLTMFFLMDCSAEILYEQCTQTQADRLEEFSISLIAGHEGEESQVAALRFLLLWMQQGWKPKRNLSDLIAQGIPDIKQKPYSVQFLAARIREFYGIPSEHGMIYYDMTNLYLENQRAEVPWIYKYINMEILRKRQGVLDSPEALYQYASHLLHMLQFSGQIVNRLQAGDNLLAIVPCLSETQCHEIGLELIRALEIEEYAVSKYIPPCLGKMFVLLGQTEREYILLQLRRLCGTTHNRTVIAALETAGIILHHCAGKLTMQERSRAEGILCIGMADYRDEIAQEAFYITGHELFGSDALTLEEKQNYFSHLAKKILTLLNWERLGLYSYFNGAALNRIYRFINDYIAVNGTRPFVEESLPIAFFPGTFDPFSLGHKQIVEEIRKMGFRVYLAVDEFSWSKKPQPFEVRRKILSMSTADMEEVYLFPEEIPVNIANPDDMKKLAEVFDRKNVYMVVGSDVVKYASAYRNTPQEWSVHNFPHLIFSRNVGNDTVEMEKEKAICQERIFAEKQYMKLPPLLEQVSSTRIRENINAGKDILGLVDDSVQNYIYHLGLYTMEPAYKKMARFTPVDVRIEEIDGGKRMELLHGETVFSSVEFHEVDASDLLRECGSIEKAERLRAKISGRTAMITKIQGRVSKFDDGRLTVLNEVLEYFQENSYSFALCVDTEENQEALKLHGFLPVKGIEPMALLDLRRPLVIFYDTPSSIKESMADSDAVRLVLRKSHIRLLEAVTKLYPGRLILCFASEILNYRLMQLITEENHVSMQQSAPAMNGEKMCVPFGKILKGVKIPNTVTKGLDTEKVYEKDLSSFTISSFPGYASLPVQIRTIGSFHRPVLLVDDLYHSGHRMREISGHFQREGMEEPELIAGVISGKGQDLARVNKQKVKAVYRVPNLSTCLIESDLYPFLGGDGVQSMQKKSKMMMAIPSINPILPYSTPEFLNRKSLGAFYELSQVCIENARDIYLVLEKEYRRQYGRQLTLDRIGEVAAEPRYPDSVGLSQERMQQSPSQILEEELERLRRLLFLVKNKDETKQEGRNAYEDNYGTGDDW